MSVKKIILVAIAILAIGGFAVLGISDAVKRDHQIKFQEIKLKDVTSEIRKLDTKNKELQSELEATAKMKESDQAEIERLRLEKEALDKQKLEAEAKLQAKKNSTNTGVVTASARTTSQSTVESIIRNAAVKNGLDPDWFYRLAKCESTWTPSAVNYNYWVDANGTEYGTVGDKYHPSGLFQHVALYWPARAAKHGYAGASVFDAEANANVTAAMWSSGSQLWECQG